MRSILMLLLGIISIQYGCSMAKQLFSLIGPYGTTTLRQGMAALLLCLFFRPWKTKLARKGILPLFLYGSVLGAMNLCLYLAIERIPIGIAVAIEFTGPLTLALSLSKKPLDFIWAFLAIIGVILLLPWIQTTQILDPVGILFAFLAAACWALYIVFGQRVGTHLSSGAATSLGMVIATLIVSPVSFSLMDWNLITGKILVIGFVMALFASAIPYTIEMIAMKKLPTKTFSILMSLEPAIAAITGYLVLGENLDFKQTFAIGCIIAASIGSTLSLKKIPLDSKVEFSTS